MTTPRCPDCSAAIADRTEPCPGCGRAPTVVVAVTRKGHGVATRRPISTHIVPTMEGFVDTRVELGAEVLGASVQPALEVTVRARWEQLETTYIVNLLEIQAAVAAHHVGPGAMRVVPMLKVEK